VSENITDVRTFRCEWDAIAGTRDEVTAERTNFGGLDARYFPGRQGSTPNRVAIHSEQMADFCRWLREAFPEHFAETT
jgi:hypothetical protein